MHFFTFIFLCIKGYMVQIELSVKNNTCTSVDTEPLPFQKHASIFTDDHHLSNIHLSIKMVIICTKTLGMLFDPKGTLNGRLNHVVQRECEFQMEKLNLPIYLKTTLPVEALMEDMV